MLQEVELSEKQGIAFDYLMDNITEYVGFGGGAGGCKTWTGCFWLLSLALKYPGVRSFIGRVELKRLRETTLVSFYKVASEYKVRNSFKYNGQDHYLQFKNGSVILLLDLSFKPSDPLYERYGSLEFTVGWIEEASESHFNAFDILKSRINRHFNDKYGLLGKLFVTCNPKKNWLYHLFYKPWRDKTQPDNIRFIQSLIGDNPFKESGTEDKLNQITNEAQKQRLLYGNWEYEDEPDQLIQFEWLQRCYDSAIEKGKKALGVDVARYGDDYTVFCEMHGNDVVLLDEFLHLGIDETSLKVQNKIKDDTIDSDWVGVDGVGIGAGVVDILHKNSFNVCEIISGEKARRIEGYDDYEFRNLRSLMWWMARENIREGKIHFSQVIEKLEEDLTAPKYEIKGERLIQIESKDDIKARIGRSTDYGDAFVYANYIRNIRNLNITDKIFDELDKKLHFVEPEEYPLNSSYLYFQVIKPNDERPPAVIWAALTPKGRFIIFNEFPNDKSRNFWDMRTIYTLEAEKELYMQKEMEYDEFSHSQVTRILDKYFAFQQRGKTKDGVKKNLYQQYDDVGLSFVPSYKSPTTDSERLFGHKKIRKQLKYFEDGKPGLVIWNTCFHTWNGMSHYIRRHEITKLAQEKAVNEGTIVEKYKDFPDCIRYLVCNDVGTEQEIFIPDMHTKHRDMMDYL